MTGTRPWGRCNDFDIVSTLGSSLASTNGVATVPDIAWSASRCSGFRADWRAFGFGVSPKLAL